LIALGSLAEGGQHDRQRGRRHQRGGHALRAAQHDQQRRIRADPDQERADSERHHAGEQDPAPPEQVGRAPPNSRNPPNVSTYAVTTQPIAALPKCSCTLMTGSATLMTVTSRMTMNWAIATLANTSHFEPRSLMTISLPSFHILVQASVYTGINVTR
jgi:hypothetical protein